jgi:hypothetical protein
VNTLKTQLTFYANFVTISVVINITKRKGVKRVKKGLTCFLFTFLLIAAPSAIKAQGLTKPISSLTTKLLSTQQETVDTKVLLPATADAISSITSNVLSPLETKNSDAITEVQKPLDSTITSIEDKVVANVPVIGNTQSANAEPAQGASENHVTSSAIPAPQEKQKIQPPIQVNVLGTAINVLGKNSDDKISLISINQQENQSSGSPINVGLDLPLVGNTNLNLLSGKDSDGPLLPAGNLAGLEVKNSPILGDLNVKLLPKEDGGATSSLVTIDSDNLLGNLHLGVIETGNDESGNTLGGLLIDLESSILGDAQMGLANTTNGGTQDIDLGVIQIGINLPILDGTGLGEILNQPKETNDDSANPPSGDTPNGAGDSGGSSQPVVEPVASDSNPQQEEVKVENPVLPEEIVKPVKILTKEDNQPGLVIENQSSLNEVDNVVMNLQDEQNSPASLFEKQTGNTAHHIGKNQAGLEKVIQSASSDSPNMPLQMDSPTGASTSTSSGSGSGAGGASFSNGGSGMSAYFGYAYQNELALSNKVQFILKELSDEWVEAPPVQPPKAFFFLSV